MEAQNTLDEWRTVSYHTAWQQLTSLNEEHSSTQLWVACTVVKWETCQTRDVSRINRNESRKVETLALKWEITKGRNPEYRGSRISRLPYIDRIHCRIRETSRAPSAVCGPPVDKTSISSAEYKCIVYVTTSHLLSRNHLRAVAVKHQSSALDRGGPE